MEINDSPTAASRRHQMMMMMLGNKREAMPSFTLSDRIAVNLFL